MLNLFISIVFGSASLILALNIQPGAAVALFVVAALFAVLPEEVR